MIPNPCWFGSFPMARLPALRHFPTLGHDFTEQKVLGIAAPATRRALSSLAKVPLEFQAPRTQELRKDSALRRHQVREHPAPRSTAHAMICPAATGTNFSAGTSGLSAFSRGTSLVNLRAEPRSVNLLSLHCTVVSTGLLRWLAFGRGLGSPLPAILPCDGHH